MRASATASSSGTRTHLDRLLLGPARTPRDARELGREVARWSAGRSSPASSTRSQSRSRRPARRPASSSSSRRAVASGVLARHVAGARGDLHDGSAERRTPLADEHHRRRRRRRAPRPRRGGARPRGVKRVAVGLEVEPLDVEDRGSSTSASVRTTRGANAMSAERGESSRCGSRPSARWSAASTQPEEQRVRPVGARLELGVRLGPHEVRVRRELDELDEPAVGRGAAAAQPDVLEPRAVPRVELVAVAVPLGDVARCRRASRSGCPPRASRGRRRAASCRPCRRRRAARP